MTRVVSLLPSATEMVAALAGDQLVGISHECDFPLAVASLPRVTAARLDAQGGSGAIDRSVRELVEQGLSIYSVDAEALRALRPDVIVTQTQCEVCAVTPRDLEQALASWTGGAPRVVSLEATRLAEVWRDVERVGEALELAAAGRALAERLGERTAELASLVRREIGAAGPTARVACLEWLDPLMAAGNWMPELVELAGGESLFGAAGEHSPYLEWERLLEADPDVVLALPCGFSLGRTRDELAALWSDAHFDELRATREGRLFALEGNQYFNRPGPRLVESLEILIELLHPEARPEARHQGSGWVPV